MRTARTLLYTVTITGLAALSQTGGASAQSTFNPTGDWNGTYGFSSTAERNLRLLRSDVIRRSEEGYYESIGRTQINNYTTNNSTTEIGQQQTTIGVVNTSTNNIDISNSAGAHVGASNHASNHGCIESNVTIDSRPNGSVQTTCN